MRRVLVANRGEIAVRVVRACFDEGLESVVACSSVDADSLAAQLATDRVVIGGPTSAESYLDVARVVQAALLKNCDAIHPGYGFLSEQPALAEACAEAGIAFIGPPVSALRGGGDKLAARALAKSIGVPVAEGTPELEAGSDVLTLAEEVGYPILIKAAAGGGGRGMGLVTEASELPSAIERAALEAAEAFGDGRVFMEHYVAHARHIEVQILADAQGEVIHLGERDCSVQRRYQKVIEEAPAFDLPNSVRRGILDSAVAFARAIGYEGAGTVEFLVDADADRYYFLEMNARVQVEHPVTEAVTGIDIVRQQLRIAAGEPIGISQEDVEFNGHAIEFRLTAEDAMSGFRPSPGRIDQWAMPSGELIRVDTHCFAGYRIPPYYDSLLAKIIVRGGTRQEAIEVASRALDHTRVAGLPTTLDFHKAVLRDTRFRAGYVTTKWLEEEFFEDGKWAA